MKSPATYNDTWLRKQGMNPDEVFQLLNTELAWESRPDAPRSEYYCNDVYAPYTYGRGAGVRTYHPRPWHSMIRKIQQALVATQGCAFEVCFLNRYDHARHALGWHADDSPEMDNTRPIAVVSLGDKRVIEFKPKGNKYENPDYYVEQQWLEHGSLLLMQPGMQLTHEHRIPKASFQCHGRISLTFRGYVHG